MNQRVAMKSLPQANGFEEGDVFVLFGELFERGYATGLVNEARKAGMKIIGITVGRRTEDNKLRPLDEGELTAAEANLGGRIINVPLMAGFDLDAPEGGSTPRDLIKTLTVHTWRDQKFDWNYLRLCQSVGRERFNDAAKLAFAEIDALIPAGRNVLFAHTMAGGVPKTKIFLALANRIYKGRGPRFLSSDEFLASDLGKLVLQNFEEVTANTLNYLIDGTAGIRNRIESGGNKVYYTAYGYHGTEIFIDDKYQWQSYANYTQGYAKKKLEYIAVAKYNQGITAVVFNCPEIRTNSSDIFSGVELPLFCLLQALKKENGAVWADEQWRICNALLREDVSLEAVLAQIQELNGAELMQKNRQFDDWPMPNDPELADRIIGSSERITQLHKPGGPLITDYLSSLVIQAAGPLMFREIVNPQGPVIWLNHDIIARQLNNAALVSNNFA